MIYFCADDYGLCPKASERIAECARLGAVNKISVLPNFNMPDIKELSKTAQLSLHINLAEGRCLSEPESVSLIADKEGNFRYSFVGLMILSLIKRRDFEKQITREIEAQIRWWKSFFPLGEPLLLDSHQHIHMIPAVFKALMKAIENEGVQIKYIRIPAEPVMPFLLKPKLYFTYSPVNIIKQCLLKFLKLVNSRQIKKHNIPTANFFGILFSGNMDIKRVKAILPAYMRLAQKKGADTEVLFHPGYILPGEKTQTTVFDKFYVSKGRKTEYDALIELNNTERSV